MEEPDPVATTSPVVPLDSDILKVLYGILGPSILGLMGNPLAIAVASRSQNRLSPSVYIIAMGVADSVYLLEAVCFVVCQKLFDEGMMLNHVTLLTRINVYVAFSSGTLSSIFLSAMSLDRLLAVRFPMKATTLCTAARAKVAVIVASLSVLAINIHLFYVVQYFWDPQLGYYLTIITSPGHPALEVFSSWFQMLAGTILPFVIISTSNVFIIVTIHHASQERSKMEYGDNEKRGRETVYLTRMLIFISLAYIILSVPYRWYTLGTKIPSISKLYNMSRVSSRKQFMMGALSASILWSFNYAINFFLYCVGGGAKYRRETVFILRRIFFCKH
ncbi:galanin receptor type 2-like [Lineus longissimus]|uniref:galanin receptor type 2-like n=1 Tax=Lineus longissimus TaxID=88925 RepID=UPI00315DF50F